MLSPYYFIARRAIVAELTLAMVALSACGYDSSNAPTYPDTPPPGPAPSSAVDIAFCRGAEPTWVAFQDGDGAWTRAQPIAAARYTTFHSDFRSTRGAVATAVQFASGLRALSIQYGVPSELAIVTDTSFGQCSREALKTLSGTVTGLEANEVALVSAGNAVRDIVFQQDGNNSYQLGGLLSGPQEILATRGRLGVGQTPETGMILRRIPTLPVDATLPAFDFGSPEVFQPEVRDVIFAGLAGEGITAYTGFRTAHSNNIVTFITGAATTSTTRPYYAIPEERLEAGELQSLGASTAPVGNVVRSATLYFRSIADRTLTFGAIPSAPVLSVEASAPTVRMHARFAAQADYDRFTSINFQQLFQQGQDVAVSLSMTQAYADLNAGGYDFVVPDLTGVDGFDSRFALRSGVQVIWTTARVGGSAGLGFNPVPSDGFTRRVGTDAGFITP